jgi:stage II sporulation protein M
LNWKRKRGRRLTAAFSLPMLLILAAFFLCGLILGQVLASRLSPATGEELRRYLSDFLLLEGMRGNTESVFFSTLCLYLRYPLLAFLAGFASIGVFLLPCATALFGGLLSFSVCCFTGTFGTGGVLLALAVFGLRCAVTFPCYFLIAEASMKRSAALARLSFGRGRAGPVSPDSREWRRTAVMFGILLLGVFVDLFLSPQFLRLALEHIRL